MAISPTRNIAAAFDASANTVYAVDTTSESAIGNVHLAGPTTSMVVPTASPIGYAAVPSATIQGFTFLGAIEVMNFSAGGLTTIAVNNAQTVVANSDGTQLLVFSNDSDSVTVLTPVVAVPPVDTSCFTAPNAVCTIVPGFDRPVFAIVSGTTAYVLNCGPQCGGEAGQRDGFRSDVADDYQHDSRGRRYHGASQRLDALRRGHSAQHWMRPSDNRGSDAAAFSTS